MARPATLLPLLLLAAAGCSGGATGTVHGTVTLDGEPLPAGVVRFVPLDGKSQTATANVTGGAFTAAVPVGDMRVEFSAPKVVGRSKMIDTPEAPFVDDVREMIPDRYNTRSELKITVKRGSQSETFPLKR